MYSYKRILKFIGRELLFFLAIVAFVVLAVILGTFIALIIAFIGKLAGIGKDIYIYVTLFICIWYAWDAMAWVVGKFADAEARKSVRDKLEQNNFENENP